MNKYLEMLDRILNHTDKNDFSWESFYDAEQDEEYFQSIEVSSLFIEDVFSDIIKDGVFIALTIDCETKEIDFISHIDADENIIESNVRQHILDSLTADELELYHSKCKAIIDKSINVLEERRKDAHNRHVDKFGGKYI